jgi:hypothetical protein
MHCLFTRTPCRLLAGNLAYPGLVTSGSGATGRD